MLTYIVVIILIYNTNMFSIRNCISEPALHIEPSDIDKMYYIEIRKFLNNCIDTFILNTDINNKK